MTLKSIAVNINKIIYISIITNHCLCPQYTGKRTGG